MSTALLMRSSASRSVWGASDQAVSSLTNFTVNLLIVRSVPLEQYGVFVLAFTAYTLAQGLLREATATPLFVRHTTGPASTRHQAFGSSAGVSLATGLVVGGFVALGALLTTGQARGVLLVLALAFPGLMLQDTLRMSLLAAGRGKGATLNDSVWGGIQLAAIGWLLLIERGDLVTLTSAWALSASGAAVLGLFQLRVVPRMGRSVQWLQEHRRTIVPLAIHFGATNGGRHLSTYAVGIVAGLQVVGVVGAAQMLLGPLNVLFMGATIVGMPEGAHRLKRSIAALRRMTTALSSGLAVMTLVWTALLLVVPETMGVAVVGAAWMEARGVVWLAGLSMAIASWSLGARIGLKLLERASALSRISLVASPIGVLLTTGGAAAYGAIGALGGSAALNAGTTAALNISYSEAARTWRGHADE